jgi:hypothetical protein
VGWSDPITNSPAIGGDLSRDLRGRAIKGSSNCPHRQSLVKTQQNIFTLVHTETPWRGHPLVGSSVTFLTKQHRVEALPGAAYSLCNRRRRQAAVMKMRDRLKLLVG